MKPLYIFDLDGTHGGNRLQTFDIDSVELEAFLRETVHYGTREVIGAEVLAEELRTRKTS